MSYSLDSRNEKVKLDYNELQIASPTNFTQTVDFNGDVNLSSGVTITGGLNVSGGATISGGLNVTGTTNTGTLISTGYIGVTGNNKPASYATEGVYFGQTGGASKIDIVSNNDSSINFMHTGSATPDAILQYNIGGGNLFIRVGGTPVQNITANANVTFYSGVINLASQNTPANASAVGTTGNICHDADYIYVCTATNTWKRVAIATW